MRRTIPLFFSFAFLTMVAGCTYPTSISRPVDDAPLLAIAGAPKNAVLVVDGIDFGEARQYSAARPVQILPGRHVVEVRSADTVLHREKLFAATGTLTTITVLKEP